MNVNKRMVMQVFIADWFYKYRLINNRQIKEKRISLFTGNKEVTNKKKKNLTFTVK